MPEPFFFDQAQRSLKIIATKSAERPKHVPHQDIPNARAPTRAPSLVDGAFDDRDVITAVQLVVKNMNVETVAILAREVWSAPFPRRTIRSVNEI